MPRRAKGLTARLVDTASKPGRYADGGGLYLVVKPTGARSWVLLYTFGGRRREMGLGGYPQVSLAAARRLIQEHRTRLANGVDPLSAAREAVPSFGEVADAYITTHAPSWRNAKHRAQWEMTLTNYAAALRGKPVNAITGPMCLRY